VTHRGFVDEPGEVRNTFGSNISFRTDVFNELGGFDVEIGGRKGDTNLQGGETELCARMKTEYGMGCGTIRMQKWRTKSSRIGLTFGGYLTERFGRDTQSGRWNF